MRLIDGAEAIRGDLPAASTRVVDVPAGAGEALETGVLRYSSVSAVVERIDAALDEVGGTPVVIGGDCGVEFAPIRRAVRVAAAAGRRLAVLWLDAHPDLNTPESSPSGAFHGMVLRALLGGAPGDLECGAVLDPAQIVLGGVRALDDAEADHVTEAGIVLLGPDRLVTPEAVLAALRASGADDVYLHVDLDVLDPGEFTGVAFPEPFGVTVAALTGVLRAVRAEFGFAGAGITEFAPSTPEAAVDDLPAVLRIVSALVR